MKAPRLARRHSAPSTPTECFGDGDVKRTAADRSGGIGRARRLRLGRGLGLGRTACLPATCRIGNPSRWHPHTRQYYVLEQNPAHDDADKEVVVHSSCPRPSPQTGANRISFPSPLAFLAASPPQCLIASLPHCLTASSRWRTPAAKSNTLAPTLGAAIEAPLRGGKQCRRCSRSDGFESSSAF